MKEFDYDYVIIGSGFGGSVSALRLTQKGYKVLVLEKGKKLQAKDFPKSNWNLKRWLWMPLFKFFGLFKLTYFRHVAILSGVGVGGGSLVYANTLPVPKSKFFQAKTWADWEEELEPHYQTAQQMLGAVPSPKPQEGDNVLKTLSEKIGKPDDYESPNVAVYFGKPGVTQKDPFFNGDGPERSGCTFCGGCMLGCRFNAKNTLDKNYLYLAEKLGVKIQPESLVYDVSPLGSADGSEGYQVSWKESTRIFGKRRGTISTRGVVFAGGVLGTIELLLNLKQKSLPALSDKLGYGIRTNSEALVGVTTFDQKKNLSEGIAISSLLHTDENSHLEVVRYSAGSGFWRLLMAPMVSGGNFLVRIFKMLFDFVKHPIKNFRVHIVKDWAKSTNILLFMQSIDGTLRFSKGLFGMKSKVDHGKAPTAFIPEAKELADGYSEIIGGKPSVLMSETLAGIPTTAHILGGAVMGSSKENGVIDKDNKVFGYENMLICDGSMISANIGVNPSLTITALSERAMSLLPAKEDAVNGNVLQKQT
ncbi:MAG: GMC oxidoreductase [Spirochaetota bacterium]